jgi:hypothetical protein
MKNLKNIGVEHLRLRSRDDIFGYATTTYNDISMKKYLNALEAVVKACINNLIFPIISYIHHDVEVRASKTDKPNYVDWWRRVAELIKNYTYELAFNLFTETDD